MRLGPVHKAYGKPSVLEDTGVHSGLQLPHDDGDSASRAHTELHVMTDVQEMYRDAYSQFKP